MSKLIKPEPGKTYRHANGSEYYCIRIEFGVPVLRRLSDGRTIKAHGTRVNQDGEIHWEYSTDGCWLKRKQLAAGDTP